MKWIKAILYILLIIIAITLQATIAHTVAFLGIVPQVVLVVVIGIAILDGRVWGAIFGGVAGLILDIAIGGNIGMNALILMWMGLLAGWIYKEFFSVRYKPAMLFFVIADVIYCFVYYFFNIVVWGNGNFGVALWRFILPEVIMTTIFCLPIFWCIRMAIKRFERR